MTQDARRTSGPSDPARDEAVRLATGRRAPDLPLADVVYARLYWGADKAVTISDMAELLGQSRRAVEAAVEALRRSGAPVCTGSRGVWLSRSSAELFEQYRALRRRALHQLANLRQLQRTARSMQSVEMQQTTLWAS